MSKKEIDPRETVISPELSVNGTSEIFVRQEDSLASERLAPQKRVGGYPNFIELPSISASRARKALLHTVASAGVAVAGFAGGFIDTRQGRTNTAEATSIGTNTQSVLIQDGDSDLSFNFIAQNGATLKMLEESAADMTLIKPFDELKGRVKKYATLTTTDLKCNQNGTCDWNLVKQENDRNGKAVGKTLQFPVVIVKSDNGFGNGDSEAPICDPNSAPTIKPFAVVRPEDAWRKDTVRLAHASTLAHEYGHAATCKHHTFLGPTGDLMDHQSNSRSFSPQNEKDVRDFMTLATNNPDIFVSTNKPKMTVNGASIQSVNLSDMTVSASITTVFNNKQLFSKITPSANIFTGTPDGAVIPEYIGGEDNVKKWTNLKTIPAPKIGVGGYDLLPGMSYDWEVKLSNRKEAIVDQKGYAIWDDPRWNTYEGRPGKFFPNPDIFKVTFKTPDRNALGITPVAPKNGEMIGKDSLNIQWDNKKNPDVFYYEAQVSGDEKFNVDPTTATDSVWWNLVHGGVTDPFNSWKTPKLDPGKAYYWRVRPRVQGDGEPVEWSKVFNFKTADKLAEAPKPRLIDDLRREEHLAEVTNGLVRLAFGLDSSSRIDNYIITIPAVNAVLPQPENNRRKRYERTYSK